MWEFLIRAYRVLSTGPEVEFIPIRVAYLRVTSYIRSAVAYVATLPKVQAASIATDASLAEVITVTATTNAAIQFTVPTNAPPAGFTQRLTYILTNASGGAMGAVTFQSGALGFRSLAVVPPANGNFIVLVFQWNDVAQVWDEVSVSADTPV